jgi:putative transposase
MGSVGDAYDNAMAESFFASLECELIDRRSWKSKAEAKMAVFTWIESWYNPRRLHSALAYLSPINFEEQHRANNDRATSTGLPTASVGSSQAPTAAVDNPTPESA